MTARANTERPRVVVTRRLPDSAIAILREHATVWVSPHDRPLVPAELRAAVAGADVVVALLHDRIDDAVLDAAGPTLRGIANVAVGYDNVDVRAAHARGVTVTNTPGVLVDATADLAMALILAITRRIGEGERLLRAEQPWSWNLFFMLGVELRGKTLGVIGLGDIGAATARRAAAFGMEIVYHGRRNAPEAVLAALGSPRRLTLDELLETSDVVSIHCPLTAATKHLIDRPQLAAMKRGAYLINTGRGPIVNEAALAEALAARTLRGAALDVFEEEPRVHPGLLDLDNVVIVPHLGSATIETRTAMAELAARNAVAMVTGAPPPSPVSS